MLINEHHLTTSCNRSQERNTQIFSYSLIVQPVKKNSLSFYPELVQVKYPSKVDRDIEYPKLEQLISM